MADLSHVQSEFLSRLERVPSHGLGLSVDVYSPDLTSLLRAFRQRQVQPAYLEIFRAVPATLESVKQKAGPTLLTYHGEGLWLTEPDVGQDPVFLQEVREVARHLRTLQAAWVNHECATKYLAGYQFGTYLPPLYTESSALVVAENTRVVQEVLDRDGRLENGHAPLVLLEVPPLTYFVTGTLKIPTFFRIVTDQAPCGVVLDVGHLWTIFRYSGAWRRISLEEFLDKFLMEFPVERVVEIHMAGLAVHESNLAAGAQSKPVRRGSALPVWTDSHPAPIPPVLFEMLDRILSHPRLTSLKGLALEVDSKPEGVIIDEFSRFAERYASACPAESPAIKAEGNAGSDHCAALLECEPVPVLDKRVLKEAYEYYARVVAGRSEPKGPEWNHPASCTDELETYRSIYLPYEILHWGGDLEAMFPASCRRLDQQGVPLSRFVPFWFRRPRPLSGAYDFFLLKIERFVEFVHEEAPEWTRIAEREAVELRQAYWNANQPPVLSWVEST